MSRSLWRRFVLTQQDDAPGRLVNLLLNEFPEITAWWERKTVGPHLRVFPAIALPPRHKFSGVLPSKSASPRSKLRYLIAHGWTLSTWGTGLLLAVFVGWSCAPTFALLLTASFSVFFVAAVLVAVPLGWVLGAIFLWPFVITIGGKINGAPFHDGDLVRILVGPHRDYIVRVYSVWTERNQVRVEIDEQSVKDVKDVFMLTEVCREKVAKPASETNVD